MRLSVTDVYVFKALGYLATRPLEGYTGSEALSKAAGVNRTYLVRILAALTASGLIESKKGAGGGYRLPRAAAEISLREVLRAIDGPIAPLSCVSMKWPKECPKACSCNAHTAVWMRVRDAVLEVLADVTVMDLAKDFEAGINYDDCLNHLLTPSEMLH